MKLFRKTVAALLCLVLLVSLSIPCMAAQNEANPVFVIENIDYEQGELTARVAAAYDCTLVVSFIKDDSETTLCMTSAAVVLPNPKSAGMVEVKIDCESLSLPRYFIIKACLLDSNLRSLGGEYATMRYTEAYHAFSEKNVIDFNVERSIAFNSDGSSFAAIKRNAVVLPYNGTTNIVVPKDTAGAYVFNQTDTKVKALKAGDVLFHRYGEGTQDYILIKVKTIEFSSDTTCIVYADSAALSDLFDCIKIDLDLTPGIDTSKTLESGVTYTGVSSDGAYVYDIDSRWLTSELAGQIELFAGAHFSLCYDGDLFGEDYYEISFTPQLSVKSDLSFSGKLSKTVKLLPVTLYSPLAGISASAVPELSVSTDGKCSLAFSNESKSGTLYSTPFGYVNSVTISQPAVSKLDCKADTSVSIGLSAAYKLTTLKNCSVEATASQQLKLKAQVSQKSEEHDCESCMAIAVNTDISDSIKMTVGRKTAGGNLANESAFSEIVFGSYYNSSKNGFGAGACPSAPVNSDTQPPATLPTHSYAGEKKLAEYAPSGALSFNRCAPSSKFTVIVVRDAHAKELLSSENLVYIGNTETDKDGLLSMRYDSAVTTEPCNLLLCGDINENNSCAHVPCVWASALVPPCMLAGVDAVFCAKCGETISDRIVPGKSHNWSEWTIVTEATLENDGLKSRTCSLCNRTEEVVIDKMEVHVYPIGDADGDFIVTAADARLALRHSVMLTTLTETAFSCADVDGDSVVSSADARLILRIAVKLEDFSHKTITVIE